MLPAIVLVLALLLPYLLRHVGLTVFNPADVSLWAFLWTQLLLGVMYNTWSKGNALPLRLALTPLVKMWAIALVLLPIPIACRPGQPRTIIHVLATAVLGPAISLLLVCPLAWVRDPCLPSLTKILEAFDGCKDKATRAWRVLCRGRGGGEEGEAVMHLLHTINLDRGYGTTAMGDEEEEWDEEKGIPVSKAAMVEACGPVSVAGDLLNPEVWV